MLGFYDPVSAAECMEENFILKQIAPHCIDNTGGWFVIKVLYWHSIMVQELQLNIRFGF